MKKNTHTKISEQENDELNKIENNDSCSTQKQTNNSTFECKFCGTSFVNNHNLLKHQKTSAKCKGYQKLSDFKNQTENEEKIKYQQEIENTNILHKKDIEILEMRITNLINIHQRELIELKHIHQQELQTLRERNLELEAQICIVEKYLIKKSDLDKIKNKSTTNLVKNSQINNKIKKTNNTNKTNNTFVNNYGNNINLILQTLPINELEPLTKEFVKEIINKGEYTYEFYKQKIPGIIKFILILVMKNGQKSYVCLDKYLILFFRLEGMEFDEQTNHFTGDWIKDPGAQFLKDLLDELTPLVKKFYNKHMEEINKSFALRKVSESEYQKEVNESKIFHDDVCNKNEKLFKEICQNLIKELFVGPIKPNN